MSINWAQISEDFRQKYEGTFCRYISPITKVKEVFSITHVDIQPYGPPNIVMVNSRAGELFLTYNTEAELDFTFPPIGCFQHGDKALLFKRLHQRQYRKGICTFTAHTEFPYAMLCGTYVPGMDENVLESAFKPQLTKSISDGLKELEDKVSVVLSNQLSVGHGNKEGDYWLWFNNEPIATVKKNSIEIKLNQFTQEVRDFIRDTRDYARAVV